MAFEIEFVFETDHIELYKKIKVGAIWQTFIVIFKYAPENGKFPLGWNGSRFAMGSEYDRLKKFSPDTLAQVETFLAKNCPASTSEFESKALGHDSIDPPPAQRTIAFEIRSEWLYENRSAISWQSLVGAEVLTATGQRHLITAVENRPWPTGPLITVRASEGPTSQNGRYNIQAFNSGPFKSLVPTAQQTPSLRAVLDQLESIQIAQEEVERERQAAQRLIQDQAVLRKAQDTQALNESRKFDLLIFDLDDTLLSTGHLEAFRGKAFIGSQSAKYIDDLAMHARSLTCLVPEELLLSLQSDFPSMALSIFTRAPRDYTAVLLAAQFPRVKWNSIVTFEDVAHTKPHPEGIYLAKQMADVKSASRVALVGDGKTDMLAAYQAGIQAVLLVAGWGPNWSSPSDLNRIDHYKSLGFMPDAKIATADDLVRLVTKPVSLLPCLEAWEADSTFTQLPESMRVDTHNHFNNLNNAGYPNWVETHAMGRYFPKSSSSSAYDFSQREQQHLTTKAILDAKDGIPYPQSWAECGANYISGYANDVWRKKKSLLVCSIPSSPGSIRPLGRDRLVDLFKAIEILLKGRCNATLSCEILQYASGALSNKTLSRDARFANVRDHLFVADTSAVQGMAVLVIDDVSTSGATFFYAAQYLTQSGAYSVRCLALTQTIS